MTIQICRRERFEMASLLSHSVAALGVGACFYTPQVPKRVWAIGTLCSLVPDLDTFGFHFGVGYGDFGGHRGFTHSIIFAALVAAAALGVSYRYSLPSFNRFSMWMYFFLATASHGLLDAMTDGGRGVAFFAPIYNRRYLLPWTPIQISPMGIKHFFTAHGLALFRSEILWIWFPAALVAVSAWVIRRREFDTSDS